MGLSIKEVSDVHVFELRLKDYRVWGSPIRLTSKVGMYSHWPSNEQCIHSCPFIIHFLLWLPPTTHRHRRICLISPFLKLLLLPVVIAVDWASLYVFEEDMCLSQTPPDPALISYSYVCCDWGGVRDPLFVYEVWCCGERSQVVTLSVQILGSSARH